MNQKYENFDAWAFARLLRNVCSGTGDAHHVDCIYDFAQGDMYDDMALVDLAASSDDNIVAMAKLLEDVKDLIVLCEKNAGPWKIRRAMSKLSNIIKSARAASPDIRLPSVPACLPEDAKVDERPSIRKEAALHIDPETAEVMTVYWQITDPEDLGPERTRYHSVGREYFARSPGSDIWVEFEDLPKATGNALWEKHKSKLGFPVGSP